MIESVKSGVQLWDGLRIADDVFMGPNATFAMIISRGAEIGIFGFLRHREKGASIGAARRS